MKKTYYLILLLACISISAFAQNKLLSTPELTTRLTEDYPLEMPRLRTYPIYINASVDDPDTISEVSVEIDGVVYPAEEETGFYYYLWTPSQYGDHEIILTAKSSNGEQASLTRNISVASSSTTKTVTSIEDVVIEFTGQNDRWYYGKHTFPQFVGAYNDINSYLNVQCPSIPGGCDDWDRVAYIDIKAPDGNWIQLIRYITPYGVACSHELNLSDYSSLLQGDVELRIFIDTWGTGGWQLTLDTKYTSGAPQFDYSNVVEVWDDIYSFGDPSNLQPVPTFSIDIPAGVESSHLRISNTGHNWGGNNTGNAAEFFNATHYIDVDGTQTFTQNLWNVCNPNPDGCTGQRGTWQHNRAGWCPGAISPPDIFNLNPYIGSTIALDYRFHPSYKDYCHPNNPDCVTGQTCQDCNDGSNPIYYVDTHIINRSNTLMIYGNTLGKNVIDNTKVYEVQVFPNPSNGIFKIHSQFPDATSHLSINTIDGRGVKTYFFKSASELNNYDFDLSGLASGIYFINIQNEYGAGVKKIIIE